MIGTHAPKMLDSRVKQGTIRADILKPNRTLISSATVELRKKYWALPRSAAELKIFSEAIEAGKIPEDDILPDIEDNNIKQVLLPMLDGDYVCATPVPSSGLMYEFWRRTKEQGIKTMRWIIQPTPAAIATHGQGLLAQGGSARLLMRGSYLSDQASKWKGDFVQLTCRVERMNIASGMVAAGWPAMTAIGGMVHALERKVGFEIDFSFGMKSCEWRKHVQKVILHESGTSKSTSRVDGKRVSISPRLATDKMIGTAEIVLLLRPKLRDGSDVPFDAIAQNLKTVNRIAGGSVFEPVVTILRNARPDPAVFIADMSRRINRISVESIPHVTDSPSFERTPDLLDKALSVYAQPNSRFTLNATGYEFLEIPQARGYARHEDYPHVWCETGYSLVRLTRIGASAWWTRRSTPHGVYFEKAIKTRTKK